MFDDLKSKSSLVAARGSGRGVEDTVEAVRHVDGHVGSSQLFESLGVQNQEECGFILEREEHEGKCDLICVN